MENKDKLIPVDQLGYPVDAEKLAFFYQGGDFRVINNKTSEVVFQGQVQSPIDDQKSGKVVYVGDFTSLNETGNYVIEQNDEVSFPFTIHESPYNDLHKGLLKAFYFFRCGMDLEEESAGPWKHAACHTAKGKVYGEPDRLLDSSGGWHDAGDYGKYTVAGAKAAADLLLAYELYPNAFQENIPIPESDNRTPDVLHECRYELKFLLKMQDKRTGGVFHKLTKLHFAGLDVMPEDDLEELYFSPISATATGSFAAIMALAARIYLPFDSDFSRTCLDAALEAWSWLQNHPEVPGFKNPPEISTGEYGDDNDTDERYWAAAELFRATGEEQYFKSFKELAAESFSKEDLGWTDVGGYGTLAYLLNPSETDTALFMELKENWINKANERVQEAHTDGFHISLREEEYIWGSNMVLMNQAMQLLIAYRLIGNKDYERIALNNIHYLLGRNVLNTSYVTGFGDCAVQNPHHRPSIGDSVDAPVPGLVSGGPNKGIQDEAAKMYLKGKPAAQAFIDHKDSYSTNEVTIYWNSPAVFAVSHFIK